MRFQRIVQHVLLLTLFFYSIRCESSNTRLDSLEIRISAGDTTIPLVLAEEIRNAEQAGDCTLVARASYIFGKYYLLTTFDYPLAYNYFFRALPIYEKAKIQNEVGKCLMQIGLIYFINRSYEEAVSYFRQAYHIISETGDKERASRCAYLLGLSFSESSNHDSAYYFLSVASEESSRESNENSKREYRYGMGIYYLNKGIPDSVLHYLMPLLEEDTKAGYYPGIQRNSSRIARAYFLKGDFSLAEKHARQVLAYGRNINTEYDFITCYEILYKISKLRKNYKDEADYLEKFITLSDSVFNRRSIVELTGLKFQHEMDKERQMRDLMEAKKEAEQQRVIDKQNALVNIFIVILSFSIVFVIILINTNKIRKKKNKQLAESLARQQSMQEQLVHQEKLASMGKLSAGIAHEMRNPLNFVNNFSEVTNDILREYENSGDEQERNQLISSIRDNVQKISQHGKRAQSIVSQIIDHVHPSSGTAEETDVNHLCDSYLRIVIHAIKLDGSRYSVDIVREYDEIPSLFLNRQEFGRALINIFSNSHHALEEKLKLEKFSPVLKVSTSLMEGYVIISIQDNGVGVKPENLPRVFEPFFTTKPAGKGTGLGMSIASDIVLSYGGKISIDSVPMQFTVVKIRLPVK